MASPSREVMATVESGDLIDVREGRHRRRRLFTLGYEQQGRAYTHNELTVIYVIEGKDTTVITVIARYGRRETQA